MSDTITTWRELSEELTDYQRAEMELFEAEIAPWHNSPKTLLTLARGMVNEKTARLPGAIFSNLGAEDADAPTCRATGQAFIDAADALDRLNGDAPPFM